MHNTYKRVIPSAFSAGHNATRASVHFRVIRDSPQVAHATGNRHMKECMGNFKLSQKCPEMR